MHSRLSLLPLKLLLRNNIRLSSTSNSKETLRQAQHYTRDVLYQRFQDLNNWYTKVIGLDEVKQYQDRVVQLQEKLLVAQEKRREVSKSLADIRRRSNELQDQIHKVKRQEDLQRFLELMKEETEVLQMEKNTQECFSECDREERELFTAFTNAVRDSHEKQRAQLEYTKYFGLILSIVGSFLTFCYSSLKKHELKRFIEQNVVNSPKTTLEPMIDELSVTQKGLNHIIEDINGIVNDNKKLVGILDAYSKETKQLQQDRDRIMFSVNANHREIKNMLEKLNANIASYTKSISEHADMEKSMGSFECLEEDNTRTNNIIFYGMLAYACYLIYKTISAS